MGGIVTGHIESTDFDAVVERFAHWNPKARFGRGVFEGDGTLTSDGVQYVWLESGSGEVFLPKGTRTQEGDGKPLDSAYVPDRTPHDVLDALGVLADKAETFDAAVRSPIQAIVDRRRGHVFVGDIAGELWLLVESGLARERWSSDAAALEALDLLFRAFRQLGWAEKTLDGWEPFRAGDQLAVTAVQPLKVRGAFRYWFAELTDRTETHTSPARRLVHLRDTAGGCNFAFDAFRRLPLTWIVNSGDAANPDGINRVNSHVVNIAAETSRTHYHPVEPVGGGQPQSEMYLVLNPADYGLKTYGRTAWLTTFPNLDDLTVFEKTPLRPGSTVYIEPGTGHRGIDAFVNVVTLPGFKPGNEIYLDQLIKDRTDGNAPYNAALTI